MMMGVVVNCFQIVFYRSLTQYSESRCIAISSCELLSNCILSIFDTVFATEFKSNHKLWIAFKLYFIDLWHSQQLHQHLRHLVVNCFQIVFYRSLTQSLRTWCNTFISCELLSNCILSIFDTVWEHFEKAGGSCELLSNCILSIFDTVIQPI